MSKIMIIGVLSDTHIPKTAQDLPSIVYKELKHVDLILHAGDLVEMSVVERLSKLAPVKAVYGNMDGPELRTQLPKKDIIKAGGFRIGLIHGYGAPKMLVDIVRKEFDRKIDVIVFGHSHTAMNEKMGNTLMFNPGSPTDTVFAHFNSFGILEAGETITGKIIRI